MTDDTPANSAIRFAGARAAIERVHPLCNPYLTGPEDSKREWLLGYSFAQKLPEIDRQRMKLALMEREQSPVKHPEGTP